MNYGNKDKTEINLPISEDNTLEMEQYISVGVDKYNFGDISINDFNRAETNSSNGFHFHFIGKAKVIIDLSGCEYNVDVRGVLIRQIEQQIKDEQAEHVRKINHLEAQLSKLQCIEYSGDK